MAKILIADDDAAVQTTVRLLLERAGHQVVAASDGRRALDQLEGGDFDLLFLDIFMPGMDDSKPCGWSGKSTRRSRSSSSPAIRYLRIRTPRPIS